MLSVLDIGSPRRPRPVSRSAVFLPYGLGIDLQQQPPHGWCPNCGAEIYANGQNLCRRCLKEEGTDNGGFAVP